MYVKLFERILDSSVWLEPSPTRVVWITLLASSDADGFAAFAAIGNLSRRAGVTEDEAAVAVSKFESPDPNSSNPDNEGRRIERVPGGWIVLNHKYYRDLMRLDEQREHTRLRVSRFREKNKGGVTNKALHVTPLYVSVSESLSVPDALKRDQNFIKIWAEWLKYRCGVRGKVKNIGMMFQKQLERLNGYSPMVAAEMLNQSMTNGWTGIFDVKGGNGAQPQRRVIKSADDVLAEIKRSDETRK